MSEGYIPVLDCVSWSLQNLASAAEREIETGKYNGELSLLRGLIVAYAEGRCRDDYLLTVFNDAFGGLYARRKNPRSVARKLCHQLSSEGEPTQAKGLCRLIQTRAYEHYPMWGRKRFVWINQ